MKKLITEVAGWKIGDAFFREELNKKFKYVIIAFPSKKSVIGRLVPDSELPITCKISICDLILENGSKNKHRCPNG